MTENEAIFILDVRISRFDHADDVNEALNVASKALETVQKIPEVIEELEKMIGKCHSEMKELENKKDMYSHYIFDELHYQAIAYNEAIRIIKERLLGNKMTENEAKEMLQAKLTCMNLDDLACVEKGCSRNCDDCEYNYLQGTRGKQEEAIKVAVSIFEEIQQYRTLGTVEELREAMEKQRAKKPLYKYIKSLPNCPTCGEVNLQVENEYGNVIGNHSYCPDCGQKIDWSKDT